MIDMISQTQVITTTPSLTHEEMVNIFTNEEDIKNFIGGAEMSIVFLNEKVPFDFGTDDNDNIIEKTWREYALYTESLDGTKVFITIATPIGYKDGRCISAGHKDEIIFLKWATALSINNIKTKSEFYALIKANQIVEEI